MTPHSEELATTGDTVCADRLWALFIASLTSTHCDAHRYTCTIENFAGQWSMYHWWSFCRLLHRLYKSVWLILPLRFVCLGPGNWQLAPTASTSTFGAGCSFRFQCMYWHLLVLPKWAVVPDLAIHNDNLRDRSTIKLSTHIQEILSIQKEIP